MIMPNFLIIGAAKAGTTSLWYYLKQHPQVYLSPVKEPHFFTFEGERLDFQGPGDDLVSRTSITDITVYRTQFQQVSSEQAIGEASTTYLYSPRAAERIHHHIPDVKLIAILRHPVDRAYSSFLHKIREGHEPFASFADALRAEEERIRQNWEMLWHYKHRGFYYTQVKRYYTLFHPRQVRVYLYEDLDTNPLGTVQDVCRFLEINDSFIPAVARHQASGVPKSKVLNTVFIKLRSLRPMFESVLPHGVWQPLVGVGLKLKNRNLVKPKLHSDVHGKLIEEYREDILKLQDLLQRDLSSWLQ